MRHFCWFLDNVSSAEKLIIFAKTWKIEKNPVWELVISTPGFPDFWNIATISNSKYFFKGQTTREKVISLSFSIESYLDPVGLATVKLKNSFVQWASQTGSLTMVFSIANSTEANITIFFLVATKEINNPKCFSSIFPKIKKFTF